MSLSLRWRAGALGRPHRGSPASGAADGLLQRLRQLREGWREFFRHHGVWAPGVRLHRRLDFRAKATLVALAFVLPTALLAMLLFGRAWQDLGELGRARDMLAVAQATDGLLDAVHRQRVQLFDASAPSAAAGEPLLAGWRALEQAHRAAQPGEAVQARYRALVERFPQVVAPPVGPRLAEVRLRTAFIEQLLDFDEALLLDTPLDALRDPGASHRARLAVHLLLRVEQGIGTAWARAHALAVQGDASRRAFEPYAAAYHPLQAQIERARGSALALGAGAEPGSQAAAQSAALLQTLQQTRAAVDALHAQVLDGVGPEALLPHRSTIDRQRQALRRQQADLAAQLRAELAQRWQQQRDAFALFVVGLGLALALANYLLYAFFHVLRGGMRQIQREVQYVAEGDLSRRPRPLGRDEAARTLALITESLGNLGGLFSVVRRGVASVAHASTEIASASADLSRGSGNALASVAAVREGIGAMVGHLEGYEQCVQQAVERARAMRTESGRSRRVMGTLAERIGGLQQRSREIGKIVGMIDGIAFQTHLLSLNASVEAARAGEAGKGFAVVAHEVRQLSMRAANAAQQIGAIVAASIAEIEQGRAITQRSVEAVAGTEAEVQGVNQVLQRLTELTCQGQANARQMAGSLDELHQFSDANARLAGQLTDAAQELRRQSLQVSEQSSRFKLA
ncbi:MAG: methyl-accepting chemotaxis protein [Burkholderiaceae bacterium]|nr:methyl-accepting chemotaxis protein [Burkholderiaceae bacterium]